MKGGKWKEHKDREEGWRMFRQRERDTRSEDKER